jgi:hypothetical protein
VADTPATDVVVLGSFGISLVDGNHVKFDFTARFVVERGDLAKGEARLRSVQFWTDPTAMLKATKAAKDILASQN